MDEFNSNDLNAPEIRQALGSTVFVDGLNHFATIDSTNTYALDQAKQGAAHGSYYLADEQTAGRGRSDHQWQSNAGQGLYLSVLIRPEIAATDLVWIPLLAGLAAHRAIHEVIALSIDLRWPNDLLIGSRKTGGILVEALTEQSTVTAVVIGIGINLHQQSFPRDLSTPATSLYLETGRFTSRQQLLIALLQALDVELATLQSQQALSAVPARIAAISSWVEGRKVEVHGPQPCTGITAGLDARGFLRVQTSDELITVLTGGIRAAD